MANNEKTENMPAYEENKIKFEKELQDLQLVYQKLISNEKTEKIIADLENAHEKNLEKQAELQQKIDICSNFISEKCKIVENAINSRFKGIKFKMFKFNKGDGELKETFEIYFNAKKYGDDLSYSTKLLVSYWISTELQTQLGVCVPIILDNMESTSFDDENINTQIILLEKITQPCPSCGKKYTGRRRVGGDWKCSNCQTEFIKHLVVNERN